MAGPERHPAILGCGATWESTALSVSPSFTSLATATTLVNDTNGYKDFAWKLVGGLDQRTVPAEIGEFSNPIRHRLT